jgi:hypothetical protein
MRGRTDISSILVIGAALMLTCSGASAQAPQPETCQSRISAFVLQNARPQGRFVLTFTGTQRALQPLWEDISGSDVETTLFPIDRAMFVLTIRAGVVEPRATKSELDSWAGRICNLATANGARYNGALAYSAADKNDMIEADMSPPPAR